MKMKETLHLGKTAFPMRGNLPNREIEWQKDWEEQNIYQQRQALNEGNQHLSYMMALPMRMAISTLVMH